MLLGCIPCLCMCSHGVVTSPEERLVHGHGLRGWSRGRHTYMPCHLMFHPPTPAQLPPEEVISMPPPPRACTALRVLSSAILTSLSARHARLNSNKQTTNCAIQGQRCSSQRSTARATTTISHAPAHNERRAALEGQQTPCTREGSAHSTATCPVRCCGSFRAANNSLLQAPIASPQPPHAWLRMHTHPAAASQCRSAAQDPGCCQESTMPAIARVRQGEVRGETTQQPSTAHRNR